jgi:hypothetical protein
MQDVDREKSAFERVMRDQLQNTFENILDDHDRVKLA